MEIVKFKGVPVRIGEEVCLTDMWKAAKGTTKQHPREWRKTQQATGIIAELEKASQKGEVLRAETGRHGGTWAHWQLGLAYARYLSPKFEVWCNTVLKGVINAEPEVAESIVDRATDEDAERIANRAKARKINRMFNTELAARGSCGRTHGMIAAMNCQAVTGKRPREFTGRANVKGKGPSARDLMDPLDLQVLAGLEAVQIKRLRGCEAKGHDRLISEASSVAFEFSRLLNSGSLPPPGAV